MEKINSSAVYVKRYVLHDQFVEVRMTSHDGINSFTISIVAGKQVKNMEDIYQLGRELYYLTK